MSGSDFKGPIDHSYPELYVNRQLAHYPFRLNCHPFKVMKSEIQLYNGVHLENMDFTTTIVGFTSFDDMVQLSILIGRNNRRGWRL